jgi:hypothetical protein
MQFNEAPAFLYLKLGKGKVFAWSTFDVFDVTRPLAAELEFEQAVEEFAPVIIFLRAAVRDYCWHNPNPGAGIVIDDPLLRQNYGFLNFSNLLESARKNKYHVTLAFIPWNHWRTRGSNVRLFLEHADCFGVCAHGCDHTNRELRSTDYEALLDKNFVARRRMKQLSKRTGLDHDPLMVCPQEQYSLEAMRSFADSRQFMGLLCTACIPRDLPSPRITGADLLLPAQDSFFGFPVFKRHYSGDMSVFAMALFLGKPAILVEHHEFFRNGPSGAEKFVASVSQLHPALKWKSLFETVVRTHARRRISDKKWEVRFFTDRFELEHSHEESICYSFIRRTPESATVKKILVSGKEVPFHRGDGFLTFEKEVRHPETVSVHVDVASVRPTRNYSLRIRYQASVALRRGLSEVRDNIVARNRFAFKAGSHLMKLFKQTGSSD